MNKQRIQKMQQRYKLVEQLKSELKAKLKQIMSNEATCKDITQKLIVQGMLRMMERNVLVESIDGQKNTVQSLFPSCQKQFAEIFKK